MLEHMNEQFTEKELHATKEIMKVKNSVRLYLIVGSIFILIFALYLGFSSIITGYYNNALVIILFIIYYLIGKLLFNHKPNMKYLYHLGECVELDLCARRGIDMVSTVLLPNSRIYMEKLKDYSFLMYCYIFEFETAHAYYSGRKLKLNNFNKILSVILIEDYLGIKIDRNIAYKCLSLLEKDSGYDYELLINGLLNKSERNFELAIQELSKISEELPILKVLSSYHIAICYYQLEEFDKGKEVFVVTKRCGAIPKMVDSINVYLESMKIQVDTIAIEITH